LPAKVDKVDQAYYKARVESLLNEERFSVERMARDDLALYDEVLRRGDAARLAPQAAAADAETEGLNAPG
jgi:hypothetical protein